MQVKCQQGKREIETRVQTGLRWTFWYCPPDTGWQAKSSVGLIAPRCAQNAFLGGFSTVSSITLNISDWNSVFTGRLTDSIAPPACRMSCDDHPKMHQEVEVTQVHWSPINPSGEDELGLHLIEEAQWRPRSEQSYLPMYTNNKKTWSTRLYCALNYLEFSAFIVYESVSKQSPLTWGYAWRAGALPWTAPWASS